MITSRTVLGVAAVAAALSSVALASASAGSWPQPSKRLTAAAAAALRNLPATQTKVAFSAQSAGSKTFTDPAGDSRNAPDVTTVVASDDDAGMITFEIELANRSSLATDDLIFVMLDSDRNALTGLDGADYAIVEFEGSPSLLAMSASSLVEASASTLSSSFESGRLTFSINRSELDVSGFNFGILTGGDLRNDARDVAPNTGLWDYELPARAPTPRIGTIAYRDGEELWLANADGTGKRRLTRTIEADSPSWSPNGSRIAFSGRVHGQGDIYVIGAYGSAQRRLTRGRSTEDHPSWSPDGTRIAFESNRAGSVQIYVMDKNGNHVRRLTRGPGRSVYPRWSPNGKQIAFTRVRRSRSEVYVMNANGSRKHSLTRGGNSQDASWSPDGTQLVYVSSSDWDAESCTCDASVFVMNADGRGARRLTPIASGGGEPAWSPDGTMIAVTFPALLEGSDVFVMSAEGTRVRALTRSGDGAAAAWRPLPRPA